MIRTEAPVVPDMRRRSLISAGAASLLAPLAVYGKEKWPSQTIKIVVPFAPGGSNDIIGRLLAAKLGARMHNAVVVENKGGAGGTIGTEYVTRATPDGYTLLFASTSITTNLAISKTLHYDLEKDLQPIGTIATSPFVVVVSKSLPVTTFAQFVALAKSKPGSINYGSAGIGGINHLGTELLAHDAGIKLTHVPYKGIGPAFTDLLGGQLQMLLPTVASAAQHIREGNIRGLAVTGTKRSAMLPDIPTVAEAGLPGFHLEAWFGLLGPAGMPAPVVKKLNQELNAVLAMDDVQQHLAREGATAIPGTPAALGNLIHSEIKRWRGVVKAAHIQAR